MYRGMVSRSLACIKTAISYLASEGKIATLVYLFNFESKMVWYRLETVSHNQTSSVIHPEKKIPCIIINTDVQEKDTHSSNIIWKIRYFNLLSKRCLLDAN